jgi:DNA polymerase-4
MSERFIAHVDMDAFYAQVEKLDDEQLHHQPVIVGGLGSRGVVATASYEAREFGVHSAMPMRQARELCPDAFFRRPRFDRYRQISNQIRAVFKKYASQIQPLSLDEAYLDVSRTVKKFKDPALLGKLIRREVRKVTRLTCSVGIGPNKLVAKLASEFCKPNGFYYVSASEKKEFLAPLPIGEMRGVGDKTEQRMEKLGIETIGDLQKIDLGKLQEEFGGRAAVFQQKAHGIDRSALKTNEPAKSISNETTFPRDISDRGELASHLERLTKKVSSRLAEKKLAGSVVEIKIRRGDFTTFTRSQSTEPPVYRFEMIWKLARQLFDEKAELDDRGVRLIGMGVSGLTDRHVQTDLFETRAQKIERKNKTDELVNQINKEMGQKIISKGL